MSITQLHRTAVLVDLRISNWTAKRLDRQGTQMVLEGSISRADKDRVAMVKQLVDPVKLKKIAKLTNSIRAEHNYLTLPWNDSGTRILPSNLYDQYCKNIDDLIEKRNDEVNRFLEGYERSITEATGSTG